MKATLQHRIIASHVADLYGHLTDWPFDDMSQIVAELAMTGIVLTAGEYLVVNLGTSGSRFGKATSLHELAGFPGDSMVISYRELEEAFYEQHVEWVEL